MTSKPAPVAYTSTLTPGANPQWIVTPTPPSSQTGNVPYFNCGDTMTYAIPGVPAQTRAHLTFTKKGPPHESRQATPFQEFNGHQHSPYKYNIGDILTFGESDTASNAARWTFNLSLDATEGNVLRAQADNDPELQVGSGLPG